jgi:hypothetical protein
VKVKEDKRDERDEPKKCCDGPRKTSAIRRSQHRRKGIRGRGRTNLDVTVDVVLLESLDGGANGDAGEVGVGTEAFPAVESGREERARKKEKKGRKNRSRAKGRKGERGGRRGRAQSVNERRTTAEERGMYFLPPYGLRPSGPATIERGMCPPSA